MVTHISAFQPIGDAATELRKVIPHLDQLMAVSILHSQDGSIGGCVHPWQSDGGWTVTYTKHVGWTVTDRSDEPTNSMNTGENDASK